MIVKKGKRTFIKRTDHSLKLTDEEKKAISLDIRGYNLIKWISTNPLGGKNNE